MMNKLKELGIDGEGDYHETILQLMAKVEHLQAEKETAYKEVEAQVRKNAELRETFIKYGSHASDCNTNVGVPLGTECTCGFEQALAAQEKG